MYVIKLIKQLFFAPCNFYSQVRNHVMATFIFLINWPSSFILNLYFLNMVDNLHMHGTMWVFASFCILEAIFMWIWLPEAKGKSEEEIVKLLEGKNK